MHSPTLLSNELKESVSAAVADTDAHAPLEDHETARNVDVARHRETSGEEVPRPYLVAAAAEESLSLPGFLPFYGLRQEPFDVTSDPTFLYPSPAHRRALTTLLQGIENLRGFLALIVEPGMGKTTLLNKLMEELRDSARVVFLFQTQCSSRELLGYLLCELGVDHSGMGVVTMHRTLNQVLFQEVLLAKRFVLIIDEAQNLDDSALETTRLLSDFETSHSKLIQIVLAGQPELVDTLMRPGFAQLRQRIALLATLKPLGAAETARCVEYRLRAAGLTGKVPFTPDALALIAKLGRGIPRNINNLCFHALRAGHAERLRMVGSEVVRNVATSFDLAELAGSLAGDADAGPPASATAPDSSPRLAPSSKDPALPDSCRRDESTRGVLLTGKLTQKIRSRGWSKEAEVRLEVTLERSGQAEVPVAERYFCCSLYVGEEQAATLRTGQPVRIRIEQD